MPRWPVKPVKPIKPFSAAEVDAFWRDFIRFMRRIRCGRNRSQSEKRARKSMSIVSRGLSELHFDHLVEVYRDLANDRTATPSLRMEAANRLVIASVEVARGLPVWSRVMGPDEPGVSGGGGVGSGLEDRVHESKASRKAGVGSGSSSGDVGPGGGGDGGDDGESGGEPSILRLRREASG